MPSNKLTIENITLTFEEIGQIFNREVIDYLPFKKDFKRRYKRNIIKNSKERLSVINDFDFMPFIKNTGLFRKLKKYQRCTVEYSEFRKTYLKNVAFISSFIVSIITLIIFPFIGPSLLGWDNILISQKIIFFSPILFMSFYWAKLFFKGFTLSDSWKRIFLLFSGLFFLLFLLPYFMFVTESSWILYLIISPIISGLAFTIFTILMLFVWAMVLQPIKNIFIKANPEAFVLDNYIGCLLLLMPLENNNPSFTNKKTASESLLKNTSLHCKLRNRTI